MLSGTARTNLNFSLHLGFPTPDQPLFGALVGSADPVDHVVFAAERGFAGIVDPFAAGRSADQQAAIGRVAAARGLPVGAFLYLPFAAIARARWCTSDADIVSLIEADIGEAIAVSDRLGADRIAVLGVAEVGLSTKTQYAAMAENLRRAGDIALKAGKLLCVEGVNPIRLPHMLLQGVEAAARVVRNADHPAIRLLFDTGHAMACGEDPIGMMERHGDIVAEVQIADGAGRWEIGAGQLAFQAFAAACRAMGQEAPFALEHGWSRPAAAVQAHYLETLASLN